MFIKLSREFFTVRGERKGDSCWIKMTREREKISGNCVERWKMKNEGFKINENWLSRWTVPWPNIGLNEVKVVLTLDYQRLGLNVEDRLKVGLFLSNFPWKKTLPSLLLLAANSLLRWLLLLRHLFFVTSLSLSGTYFVCWLSKEASWNQWRIPNLTHVVTWVWSPLKKSEIYKFKMVYALAII